ncbi:hypothetical protein [Enterovibrio norvegicus]|uniref:hypothetical protein n=1 Tax=Enterovibrio norvegicus TaxID=188144 RepID=UPI00352F2B7F
MTIANNNHQCAVKLELTCSLYGLELGSLKPITEAIYQLDHEERIFVVNTNSIPAACGLLPECKFVIALEVGNTTKEVHLIRDPKGELKTFEKPEKMKFDWYLVREFDFFELLEYQASNGCYPSLANISSNEYEVMQ